MKFSSALARRFAAARSFHMLFPLLILAACEPGQLKEGLAPDDGTVAVVEVTPPAAAIAVGEAVVVRASARNSNGQPAPAEVDWSADGGSLLTLTDSTARFSSTTTGSYTVRGRGRKNRNAQDSTVIVVSQPTSPVVSVTVSPDPASLSTGGGLAFSVSARRQDGTTLVPSVNWNATGGTISAAGVYMAGNAPGTYRVIATQQGGNLADTAAVTLTASAPVLQAVILSPPSASVVTGGSQQFGVSGQWSDGSTTAPAVTYSATGGTITAGGLYSAGSTAGTFRVIATEQGGSLADTAVVTLSTAPVVLQAVILTPATASVVTGGTQQFGVSGQWSDGSTTAPAVTYSATGGTISAGGLYTAGGTAGSFRVIATQQGGTLADTSAVTVTAPVLQAVILSPPTASLNSGATQQFSVSGQWSNGATTAPSVTYSATGGTVTAGGLYTAGSTAGTFRVIATQQGGTLADTSTITIAAAVLQAVILTPSAATLNSGATQQFSVSGQWSNGATTAPSVTYSATGGTITAAGLYTAGVTAGSFRVIATQQGGTLADTSTVTLTTPVLTAVILAPGNASMMTGSTQQFSVSGQWSNGATTAPSVTYSATGGTISAGGLYTAGATAGTFRVTAVQQGGTLADTATVTVASVPVGGSCPNRPANYTNTLPELNFSQAVPSGGGNERPVAGTVWSVIYDGDGAGGSNFSRVSDPTAPHSSPDVWRLRQFASTNSTGRGFGNIFRNLPNGTTKLYACWYTKLSPGYWFHPVSHKYVDLETNGPNNFLVQFARAGNYFEAIDIATDYPFPTLINNRPPTDTWFLQEIQIERGNPGVVRVWIDGQLRTENTTHAVAAGATFTLFGLYGHMGGGGYTLAADQYQYFDHILLATP